MGSATVHGLPGGLDKIFDGAIATSIKVGPTNTVARHGRLVALAGGSVLDRLPVVATEISSGVAGGIRIVAEDYAKVLRVEIRVAPDEIHGDSSFLITMAGAPPEAVLPSATFMAALRRADSERLDLDGMPPIRLRITDKEAIAKSGVADLVHYVESWNRVQDACAASITLPDQMTLHDAALLELLDKIVLHGSVRHPWPGGVFEMPPDIVEGILNRLLPRMNVNARSIAPEFLVAGRTLVLPGTLTLKVNRALVTNALALARALPYARSAGLPLLVQIQADGLTESSFERDE